jgi:uncharacterized protein YkwD
MSRRVCRRRSIRFEGLQSRCLLTGFTPNAAEQAFLEQLNDARANPAAYGAKIGVDLSGVAPSPPLAFDADLIEAARLHSQDMNDNNYFAHNTPQGVTPAQRVAATGYAGGLVAECIDAGDPDAASALAGLITDAGNPTLGHRQILLSMDPSLQVQTQVGVGWVPGGSEAAYSDYWTIDDAQPTDVVPELTGAVYIDGNGDGHYDEGDGVPNAQITIAGVGTFAAYNTGGFDIPLSPGTYTVTASAPELSVPITKSVTIGSTNVKLDFVVPTPGQWSALPSMPVTGADSAATGSDGRIYALSPVDGGMQAVVDPTSNQWTSLPYTPSSAQFVAAAAGGDGRIYAIGGTPPFGSGTFTATAKVNAWSPSAGAWQSVPDEPKARAGADAVMGIDGRIYVFGGYSSGQLTFPGLSGSLVSTVDVYSPQTNSWSSPTSLPVAKADFAVATASDGRIYLIGGLSDQGQPLARVDIYSPATNSWSQAADLPAPRAQLAAAPGPGGTIVAFGGIDAQGVPANSVYVYSPPLNVWTVAAPIPIASFGLAATAGSDGRIYAVGGQTFDSQGHPQNLSTVEALTLPTPPPYVPANLGQVAQMLTHAGESYGYFITQAYLHYLGRQPDSSGLSYWIDQMQNHGLTDERLEAGFLGSAEYIANHGGTGSGWVQGMYQDLLGRAPDAQGLNYWVAQLQNGEAPADVAYGFAASAERESQRINGDYQTYLGRPADPSGLSYWLNAFLQGATNEDLIGGFVGSAEYFNAANKGKGDPRQWVDAAFQDIFHRAASSADEGFWMGVLQ